MNNQDKKLKKFYTACLDLAKSGDPDAQYHVGFMLFWGIGAKKNRRQAVKQWREAAAHGHAIAQYWLATCYDCGFGGLKQDLALAVHWWRESAANGNNSALMPIVSSYLFSEEAKFLITKEEALEYCQKAAIAGNTLAKYFLKHKFLK